MSHVKIEVDIECKACDGTGLYIGMAERDGAAVVCYKCEGTGCYHLVIEYDEFTVRREPDLYVERVFEFNPGIMLGKFGKSGKEYELSTFGGVSYEQWKIDSSFPPKSENRAFTCPAWWYQGVDYDKKPNWRECILVGSFSSCRNFQTKEKCWKRWDEGFGEVRK